MTDVIVLVVSAVESVQPQTVEVIRLAKSMSIPVVVAINKIDRAGADIEQVKRDLLERGVVSEEQGGEVPCVPISAKEHWNIEVLEQRILDVASSKVNLVEDFSLPAQCTVIESNFDEKIGQITATLLVKKGTLRLNDMFVCGIYDGKVRYMLNDQRMHVKEAYPGQAVHIGGFKHLPDVGSPLYRVEDHAQGVMMVGELRRRREKEREAKLKRDETS